MEPPEAAPDLVGRTSARLHAGGVERRDRLEALHLLAVLDASADGAGRIKRPLDDLAAEFELPVVGVMRGLEHLEAVGALRREGAAVMLLARDADGLGGLHLAGFLDDVRAALDDRPHLDRSPWLARVGAGLVAVAAAIGILTLAPSQPAGIEQPVASAGTTAPVPAPPAAVDDVEPDARATSDPAPAVPAPEIATPDAPAVAAAAACPSGEPVATFDDGVLRITNPTTDDLVVTALTVGGVTSRSPIAVPAGQTVGHDLVATLPAPAPVTIDAWDWADPSTGSRCAS